MFPQKNLDIWMLQNAILGFVVNFSNIIQCYFARRLGITNCICAHANEMHRDLREIPGFWMISLTGRG